MKKIYYVLINIFLIFILFICADAYTFYEFTKTRFDYTNFRSFCNHYIYFYSQQFQQKDSKYFYNKYILGQTENRQNFYRKVVNENSSLPPILLFGCSYVYGHEIPESSIFSEVLGRYTGRPVYNRAKDGLGVNLMLYQLQNEDFYNIVPKPEYVIYTFIDDHLRRMFTTCVPFVPYYYDLFYKIKDNKIVQTKYFNKLFLIERLKSVYFWNGMEKESFKSKMQNLLLLQLLECNKLIKKHWKDTQFVIFVYSNNIYPFDVLQKELEQNGIKVIYRKDIAPFDDFDERYTLSKTDNHPNENAWEYITPLLMKELEHNYD